QRAGAGAGRRTTRQILIALFDEVVEGFHDRSPSVHFAPPATELLVDVDAERIRTAFRNLLENAVKYSLPDSRPVDVSTTRQSDRVVIRVTDDGPGIPESDTTHLFEPFFRVDRSRSKKTGGCGLGLSIAQSRVEGPGATIVGA